MHPLHTVGDKSGERGGPRVDPHEGRADQPQLHLVEGELLLQQRKHGVDRLPVGVVEEADEPEHGHDLPAIAGRAGRGWQGAAATTMRRPQP